jgi:hypothetical protein
MHMLATWASNGVVRVPQTLASCDDYSLNLFGEFLQLPNFNNLMQINSLGIEHSQARQLLSIEGVT